MQTIDEILVQHPEYAHVRNRLWAARQIAMSVLQDPSEAATLAVFDQLGDTYTQEEHETFEARGTLH